LQVLGQRTLEELEEPLDEERSTGTLTQALWHPVHVSLDGNACDLLLRDLPSSDIEDPDGGAASWSAWVATEVSQIKLRHYVVFLARLDFSTGKRT
jgi:hypothetical protein